MVLMRANSFLFPRLEQLLPSCLFWRNLNLGWEELDRVAPGGSGGECLERGKHFGEAVQTPASLCLPWYADWHLWNWLAPTYLWNQLAPRCLHDHGSFGPSAIAFGRPIQIHQVAPISAEELTVCYWHGKFQVTSGNFSWHSECSRRTKTFLHLKMQNTWPWL